MMGSSIAIFRSDDWASFPGLFRMRYSRLVCSFHKIRSHSHYRAKVLSDFNTEILSLLFLNDKS